MRVEYSVTEYDSEGNELGRFDRDDSADGHDSADWDPTVDDAAEIAEIIAEEWWTPEHPSAVAWRVQIRVTDEEAEAWGPVNDARGAQPAVRGRDWLDRFNDGVEHVGNAIDDTVGRAVRALIRTVLLLLFVGVSLGGLVATWALGAHTPSWLVLLVLPISWLAALWAWAAFTILWGEITYGEYWAEPTTIGEERANEARRSKMLDGAERWGFFLASVYASLAALITFVSGSVAA